MSLIVSEVYDALIEAGASPDRAKAAAGAVPPVENMATKGDIAGVIEDMAGLKEDMAAVKQDIAGLKGDMTAVKRDIAGLKGDIVRIESTMATKQDIARIEKRLAVLSFAVFSFLPAVLAFMVKLTFFP